MERSSLKFHALSVPHMLLLYCRNPVALDSLLANHLIKVKVRKLASFTCFFGKYSYNFVCLFVSGWTFLGRKVDYCYKKKIV